ncbi:hypothetical protein Tsubulata_024201 [Turnera subulata]|uniref:PAS domain-containing protein n=1 Tax=Turnera subulata TaxID=218843 RepID=A0A9Q0FV20_9ROSI|nr:hypothetical protein Tsubulata_024201 [Turnera subulata]
MAVACLYHQEGFSLLVPVAHCEGGQNGVVQSIIRRIRMTRRGCIHDLPSKSLPWENVEMDAIHSLQLILRDTFREAEATNSKAVMPPELEDMELQGLMNLAQLLEKWPYICSGCSWSHINGCNAKAAELTGLTLEEAMGKSLARDLIYKEYEESVEKLVYRALRELMGSSKTFAK